MSFGRRILLTAFVLIIVMQFIQPERNNRKTKGMDITKIYPVPANIYGILKNSCYDCHSNSTRYPWYTYIQPFGWWMASHIREGKSELNFDEFGDYSSRRQKSKLKAITESIKDETMPLPSYTLMHRSAKLSEKDKELLIHWLDEIQNDSFKKN
jgi:hypothetical protein